MTRFLLRLKLLYYPKEFFPNQLVKHDILINNLRADSKNFQNRLGHLRPPLAWLYAYIVDIYLTL